MADKTAIYHLKTGQKLDGLINENQTFGATSLTSDTLHKICLKNGNVAFVQGDTIAYIEVRP